MSEWVIVGKGVKIFLTNQDSFLSFQKGFKTTSSCISQEFGQTPNPIVAVFCMSECPIFLGQPIYMYAVFNFLITYEITNGLFNH